MLRQAFALAVRHEVLVRHPMESIARLIHPRPDPTALTATEVTAIRLAIRAWERDGSTSGPTPDGQLGAVVEVMLGTSARIGEVLAIRRRDVDVTIAPPAIRLAGTIVGQGRASGPAGPSEDADLPPHGRRAVLRGRGGTSTAGDADGPVTGRAAVLQPQRHTADTEQRPEPAAPRPRPGGLDDVSPHMFRRTVATAVHAHAGVDLAAELLGHADPRITVQHYIRRNEMVNPSTADILEQAFPPLGE